MSQFLREESRVLALGDGDLSEQLSRAPKISSLGSKQEKKMKLDGEEKKPRRVFSLASRNKTGSPAVLPS
jgi:hypothetical protein